MFTLTGSRRCYLSLNLVYIHSTYCSKRLLKRGQGGNIMKKDGESVTFSEISRYLNLTVSFSVATPAPTFPEIYMLPSSLRL